MFVYLQNLISTFTLNILIRMSKIYFFTVGILFIFICPLDAQKTELPKVIVKSMAGEKISGTINNATDFELILTLKGNESPFHIKAQNIRKIQVLKYPKPGLRGAVLGAVIGMLPGALILASPADPNPGIIDERRINAFIGLVVGGLAGSIIGHIIGKNAVPNFKINGDIDTYRQQRNAINKFGYTN